MTALAIPTIPTPPTPPIVPSPGQAYIRGDSLLALCKAVTRAIGEKLDGGRHRRYTVPQRYDLVQIKAEPEAITLSAFDGRRLAEVRCAEVDVRSPFTVYLPGALLLNIAKNIDGDVWNLSTEGPHGAPGMKLVLRDESGEFKLYADPIDGGWPQKTAEGYAEILHGDWFCDRHRIAAEKKVAADKHRTELAIKDLTRFAGAPLLKHEDDYHGQNATLRVFE